MIKPVSGFDLYDEDEKKFTFSCDSKEFLSELSKMLNKFYQEYNGKITVEVTKLKF